MSFEIDGWDYTTKPSGGDCRKIVTLDLDGMMWVGIRAFDANAQRWLNNSEPETATVRAWRELPPPAAGQWDRGSLRVLPHLSERKTLDLREVGFTLNQEPPPKEAPHCKAQMDKKPTVEAASRVLFTHGSHHGWWPQHLTYETLDPIGRDEFDSITQDVLSAAEQWRPIETAPYNRRILISESSAPPRDECAMAWLDIIDSTFYYSPQGGVVTWKPTWWMDIPETPR